MSSTSRAPAAPAIVGLDLSLVATGICFPDGSCETVKAKALRGSERLHYLQGQIRDLIAPHGSGLAVVEGYAYGAHGKEYQIGELGGVVRLMLFQEGIPVVEVSPTNLKKFATGRGKAEKEDMLIAARYAWTSKKLKLADDHQCDAWWLWQMALAHYAPTDPRCHVTVSTLRQECLAANDWPVF